MVKEGFELEETGLDLKEADESDDEDDRRMLETRGEFEEEVDSDENLEESQKNEEISPEKEDWGKFENHEPESDEEREKHEEVQDREPIIEKLEEAEMESDDNMEEEKEVLQENDTPQKLADTYSGEEEEQYITPEKFGDILLLRSLEKKT